MFLTTAYEVLIFHTLASKNLLLSKSLIQVKYEELLCFV